MPERCIDCGRFIGLGRRYDIGTRFGGPYDTEPPDPIFFCSACVRYMRREARCNPAQVARECWWQKPGYVIYAESLLAKGERRGK